MLLKLGPNMLAAIIFVLVATNTASKAEEVQCRSGCGGYSPVPQTFKFAEGTTYQYGYEGVLDVSLSSSKGQQSETKVKATVLLTQQSECNQILRIQGLQILGDSKKFGSLSDIEKPVRLNFHDGHLEDIICVENGDSQNSLNVKRAIASMFQAALKHHNTEIDIFGSCPTEFSSHKDGQTLVIKKARNLNKCSHRESIGQDYMSLTYDLTSDLKTSPLLQGSYNAEMKIKGGILDTSVVHEDYLYVPFSVGEEGAKVNVHSKLTFEKQTKEVPKYSCATPKSIIFENPHPTVSEKSISKALMDSVKSAANDIDLTLKENSAEKFSKIVMLMRKSKKTELIGIYGQVRSGAGFKNQQVARRVFMDALFRAGTGECFEAVMEMYKNNELTELETKLFFLRLSFVKHPTLGSIKGATDLLNKPDLPREATIGLGNLIGKYCQQHPCDNIPILTDFLNKLLTKLTKPTKSTEDQVLAALKAVLNSRKTTPGIEAKLIELAQDKTGPLRIRSAALEAFKANSCSEKLRDGALNILNDITHDSELRIEAYLSLVECPNGKVASAIKNLLEKEESYQVGGFIVSHLRTLRTSTNPDKALAKSQLENIRTTKKFPVDWFKYSRNIEVSNRWDSVGLGGSMEANLIYSPKSFIPTATHLNLTTQLFGHTFNFLEIDTRQENLDEIMEHYLGPLGALRKESPNNLFKHGQGTFKKIAEKISERVNKNIVKREASKQQLETFGKSINRKENELNKDLELDLSIKMFGSEALFLSISEDITKYTPEALVDKIFDKIDIAVNKLKGFDENLNTNMIFLDTDISYPTSIGFPLKLSVEGVSSMHLKTSGKLELGTLLGRGDGDYKLSLIPSANIQITSKMVVETPVVTRGLKLNGNLFTATGLNIDLFISPNNIDLKYSLPVNKQDIITATHEIVFESIEVDGTSVKTALKQPQAKDVTVCLDQLNPYLGVVLCAHLNQPNIVNDKVVLPYPLNGNSKLSIIMENSDLGMIHFTAKKFDGVENGVPKTGVELETKALCKQNKLKSALKTEIFIRPEMYFLTTFTSDKKKASAEFRAVITQSENSIFARAKIDEIEYYAKIGGSISGAPPREIYKPIMEYKAGTGSVQKSPYRIEGQIIKETSGETSKYIFDNLQVIGAPKLIKITGNIAKSPYSLEGDVSLSDGEKNAQLKGKAHYKDQQLNLNAMVKTNFNPNANFDITYFLKTGENTIDSKFQFQHGDLTKKENIFKLNNMFKRDNAKELIPFSTKNSMSYPKFGIDNEFDLTLTEKTIKMNVELGYQKIKVKTELDAKVNQKNFGDYDIEFEFNGFDNKVELDLVRAVDRTKSKLKNTLDINGKSIKLNGDVTHNFETNKIDFVTDLNLKIVGFMKVNSDLKIITNLKWNPQDTDGSLKISDAGKVLIDAFIKQSKGGNANGSLKVTIPSITMQGQLKASKYSGTSTLTIDITDVRKMKADSTFNVNLPTFNLDLTLFTNLGKDDSRKYRIATTSVFKKDSIDSKNILDILGKTTSFNIKGSNSGGVKEGKTDGEFDLTLPNDLYFAGKLNRERKEMKGVANGNVFLSLEQRDNKNAPGRKISVKGVGKNVNHEQGIYDIVYNVILENGNGKNVNIDLDFKGTRAGIKQNLIWLVNIHGAALSEAIKNKFSLSHEMGMGEFLINFEHGASSMLNVKGNLHHHHDDKSGKPCTGAIEIELKTPLSKLKVFKLKSDGTVLVPMEKGQGQLEILNNFSMFLDDDGTDPKPTVDIEMKNDWKLGVHKGKIISNVNLKGKDPVDIDLSYDEEAGKKYNYKGSLKYGAHFDKYDVTFDVVSKDEVNAKGKLETSREICKNLDVEMKYKYDRESKIVSDNWKVNYNGKNYEVLNSMGISEHYPLLSVEVKYPDGNLDKVYTKFNNVGVRSVAAETILKFHKIPFEFTGKIDVHAESIEDFDLKLEADSPQLKLNKIVITANTKETKGSNKLIVTMKKANENLISGNALYKTRQEDNKFIVEGSGTFTIKNEKKSGNFKYTKKNLVSAKDNEEGVEFSLQGSIGDKGLDSEIKITDKHRRALLSFCEQKKECANIEMDAKTAIEGEGYKSTLEMNVDLRKLGLSHEFGMKAITKVQNWDLDHTVDLHFQSQKSKYSYGLYLHPNKAGWTLTTPRRIVSLQSELNRPKLGEKGPIKGEVLFYLNKKTKPNEKTALTFTINPEFSDKITNLEMEAKLIHPALKKPMMTSYKSSLNLQNPYKLEIHSSIDVIPNSDKKITADVKGLLTQSGSKMELKHNFEFDIQPLKLKLRGESLDLISPEEKLTESKFLLSANINGKKTENVYHELISPHKVIDTLIINNQIIYDLNIDRKTHPDGENINLDLQLLGLEKILAHCELKKLESIKFYLTNAAKNPKLEVNSAFIPNQLADFRVDLHKDGKKIDFIHANIKLDEKDFLKSDYGFQGKHIKEHFVEPAKKASQKIIDTSKNSIKKATDDSKNFISDLSKNIKENEANLKPILNYYEKELNTIKTELEADETLKKISEALSTVIKAWIDFVNSMTMTGKKFAESMEEIVQKYVKSITESFEKEILPKLKEIADKLTDSTYKFAEKLNEIAFGMFEQISTFVDAHKEELKQIASVISSTTQDLNRFVVKVTEDIKLTVTKECERILEEIKALPYYDQIKMIIEKIKSGEPVPQQYIDQFQAIAAEIKNQIPLPPFQELVDYITNYLVKKMKRQDVNDLETLEHIIKMIVETIKEMAKSEGWKEPTPKMTMPLPARIISFLPKLVAFRMSWLNRILSQDNVKLDEIIMDFTLNPLSWIPPYRRYAITAQGQHIFTFDGKHLTFPGKCNYMLASDIDGKFSISGTYTNGIMTELTFFDKTDTFTIKKSGVSTLNGAATELPIRTKITDVYRLYTHVEMNSKAGVRIMCTSDLSLCVFSVSGFYHNRLRGLLGNPNFEKYDDFILPSGKVVESESEFGNSYKIQTECPAIKTVDHTGHVHDEECTKLFGATSTLAPCYGFVHPHLFKQACDHGLAAKVPNTLEAIAMAYSATCATRYIPTFLPKEFIKCTNSDKPFNLGDTFSVKTPQKAADIVFVIDVSEENKEIYSDLVTPLGESLKKELSDRGVKDVEYHIITYGGDQPKYPSHVTTNGGKMTFKGKFPNLKFTEKHDEDDIETGIKQIDFLISIISNYWRDLKIALGETPQEYAYDQAIEYPFRVHAAKTIIAVTTSPCETGTLIWAQKLRALFLYNPEVSLNIFTPMTGANFKVKDDKTTKGVIGFNKNYVLTVPDCKKNPVGNSDLLKEVSYNDFCSEFAAMAGGNVFVLENFASATKPNKKFYEKVAAYNIAESMLSEEQHLDCKCTRETEYRMTGVNECRVVDTKKKPASKRKLTRG